MIRATIELIPHGNDIAPRTTLGVIEIGNDGTGTESTGNYNTRLYKKGGRRVLWREGRIVGFPRLNKTAYDLLYLALEEQVGLRNS